MKIWYSHREGRGFAELRAGWRLALFLAIVLAPAVMLHLLRARPGGGEAAGAQFMDPIAVAFSEAVTFGWIALASWIMSRLERQRYGHYGLPGRQAFQSRFWQGAVWGAAALTVLLLLIAVSGAFSFGTLATHGGALARYGAEWAVAFLAVALFEEFTFRGYSLVTLSDGIGFWPAAIVTSIVFGGVHLGNSGESQIGAISAGLIGLFFCFTWRRTGSLWFAVGMHGAWDYCESFVYGVPDSGLLTRGRLLAPHFRGSHWITGGTVGPEGSLWVFVVIAGLFVIFGRMYPAAKQVEGRSEPAAQTG